MAKRSHAARAGDRPNVPEDDGAGSGNFQFSAHVWLFIVILATVSLACQHTTVLHIDLKSKTPPSFSFSGYSLATNFEILELPNTKPLSQINPYSYNGETIWKISAPNRTKADDWPAVTYGEVPGGFSQTIPDQGSPRKLVEGKIYAARLTDKDGESGLFIMIRNGKPLNVTDEVFDR